MLKIELQSMMGLLTHFRGERVTILEVSKETGIHRGVLSRVINRPEEPLSSAHIDALARFFFTELKKLKDHFPMILNGELMTVQTPGGSRPSPQKQEKIDRELMRWIVAELVQVFPETGRYKTLVEKKVEGSPYSMNFSALWNLAESDTKQR